MRSRHVVGISLAAAVAIAVLAWPARRGLLAAPSGPGQSAAADPQAPAAAHLAAARAAAARRAWPAADSLAREALRALPELDPDSTVVDSAFDLAWRAGRERGMPDLDALASLDTLARTIFFEQRRLVVPRRMLERGLAMRSRILPDLDFIATRALHVLGHVRFEQGEYLEARAIYERSRDGYARLRGPESVHVASMTYNLSNTYYMLGEHPEALRMLEEVRAYHERRGDEGRSALADAYLNLSAVYGGLGDPWASARAAERCIALRRAIGAPADYLSGPMVNLAATYFSIDRNSEALALLDSALVLMGPHVRPAEFSRLILLNKRAEALARLGRLDESEGVAREILRLQKESHGAEHPEIADTYGMLADLQGRQGRWSAALAYAESTAAMDRRLMPGVEPRSSNNELLFARIRLALGDSAAALEHALAAERGFREHLDVTAAGANRSTLWWREHPRMEALAMAFGALSAATGGEALKRLADAATRTRGLVLDREGRRLNASVREDGAAPLRSAFERAATRLAGLVMRGDGGQPRETYVALLDSARTERDRAERALAARSAEFAADRSAAAAGIDHVVARLPENAALVAYHQFNDPRPGAAVAAGEPRAVVRMAALVLRRNRPTALLRVGNQSTIDSLVTRWRAEAEGAAGARGARREADYRRAGEALRRQVWDPLREMLGDAGTVYLVPDGSLQLVNFATLPAPGESYLLETGPALVHLTTERDLLRETPGVSAASGLLALGGVDFDRREGGSAGGADGALAGLAAPGAHTYRSARSECPSLAGMTLAALPGSHWEARQVAATWRRARSDSAVELLSGAGATEARFKHLAPRYGLLHLATHGFYSGPECLYEAPGAGPGSKPPPPFDESPLLRAGLALAGFNRRASTPPDGEDGVLTAEEIAALDLRRVRCAVLSACDTGVGEAVGGEGVYGLRRAFQVAGVPALVTSLWRVDDLATRAWMERFYERLLAGGTPAAAAAAASRALLARARASGGDTHPATWGAFIAVGAR